jgi:F-type H+-transporting ATPase subunit delta
VSISILGKRYAKALYDLASAGGTVDRAARELTDFAKSFQESRELRGVFENPSVSHELRRKLLREIAMQMGMHDQVRDLLQLLSDRRRMSHLPEVAEAFQALVEQRSGKVRAEVTTAAELPPGYYGELERVLSGVTGKQVVLTHKVDPSLLGGVVTRIGDQILDGSLKSRLSELKDELLR